MLAVEERQGQGTPALHTQGRPLCSPAQYAPRYQFLARALGHQRSRESPAAVLCVENQNRFSPKVYTELLNTKRNARFTQCQKPMASLSLIPFPFALHSLSSSSLAVTHGNTTNQNKNERCHILTLHRFTRFHLEPRMRNIPVF